MRTNLHHLLERHATTHGGSPALTFKDTTRTYAELWHDVRGAAAGLAALGLRREDRVAVFLDKRPETVTAVFATSAAGGAFVPINPLLRPQQVAYILTDCDVGVLVTSPERLELLREVLAGCPALEHVVLVGASAEQGGPREPGTAGPGNPDGEPAAPAYRVHAWDQLGGDATPPAGIDQDIAAILYTSGSTGKPKGVVLSHRNLLVGAESVSHYLGNTADDVILSVLPLSFDAGFSQLTTAFAVGAHVVLMNYLLPRDVVRLCARHRVTGLTCVPPLWLQLADMDWPEEATRHLRYFANTGGRMPKVTLDRLRAIFPAAAPFLMYGLTEAFRSTYLDPAEVDRRPGSIGKAIPDAEILVVREDGTECAPGEEGELVHRGALVALGYWNDPARTAERFRPAPGRDGAWRAPEMAVWSGDRVVRDEEGFLYFVGRQDEMIKTSGYRVSPAEVEEVAAATGLVRDAVALGVEDPRLGQKVLLVVSPAATGDFTEEGLLAAMRRSLPLYMVPAGVVVREEIPRSPNGKFDRARLREELGAEVRA
ncbi:acyl-CoA ligase (AMP-forming), exosortase A system-associated [Georgenia thermotolerans]|uniref:Acyl-CoA ligase (AMP-forming), exosortase A system-associated n=1 Tax=Georgenia thermotolerans TaxID=527326 RepID=A0A7J5URW0_9MICO|nr:acyl-CoA ligase (AMP-forming), exosortase A system-associated [Georgenia thermotolerans]KAE8764874.1 acyl-CoA ligase (AMP-forming), exosortase A system-associated [Georgenia thermotolerans]